MPSISYLELAGGPADGERVKRFKMQPVEILRPEFSSISGYTFCFEGVPVEGPKRRHAVYQLDEQQEYYRFAGWRLA